MRYTAAVLSGRLVRLLARIRKPGGGSAIPGLVVNTIAPGYLGHALKSFPDGLVMISGSAGKSTITKMVVAVLAAHGVEVFTNPSTANIAQGLTSALLERSDLRGRVHQRMAVLELDEGHGAALVERVQPDILLLTNVMVDQIDRFHDSQMVADMLHTMAEATGGTVILNADDAFLMEIAGAPDVLAAIRYFGVSDEVLAANPRGLGYTAMTDVRLPAEDGTLLVSVAAREAEVVHAGEVCRVTLPARGVHYAVDAAAAIETAATILGESFDLALAAKTIGSLPPVFGRGEVVEIGGETVEFILVQNPASYQLNLDSMEANTEQVLLAVGSDVRDPSYLWPVDTSGLGTVNMVTGSKAWDAALQLVYDGVAVDRVEPDLAAGLDAFLALPKPAVGHKTIIFTADAMRRTRVHLGLSVNKETV
ncbi:MurT ligase domain-containing protein [Homoserinimonas sp. OAct 916]|uniref:MurT ligase domain-containing protein n=1 Tax=Homoserinimonas sp. OAct 916 TaxID=2211450 RepID=UPI000DBE9067|nr:MurT ligase domain-containing protein [Homoserinimonas sp. OAct 916]